MDLAGLVSCRDLTAEHADAAVRSLDSLRKLVTRLTEIAEPEDGAPKVLIVFARLARGDVGWLDGDLTVEITGGETRTVIDVFKEEGWGIKERLVSQARFGVPFDEFERAVEISAKRFAPLKVSMTDGKIVLSTAADAAKAAAPPPVALDEKSVGTAPPPPGFAQEPEPFDLPPPSEPEPFEATAANEGDPADGGFGAFIDPNEIDDPVLQAAIVSPKKKVPEPAPTPRPTPKPDATTPKAPEAAPSPGPAKPKADPVHSRPTVRRMVAIRPEAFRTGRKDPRREDDE
jgi:hypothetical protein